MDPVNTEDAIVNPVRGKNSPVIGPFAVMAATRADLFSLCSRLDFAREDFTPLYDARLYAGREKPSAVCLAGPMIGAPIAVMILETLIAWGARSVLFLGWCGAVSPDVRIGDIVVPDRAIIDEGTSRHYRRDGDPAVACPGGMTGAILQTLEKTGHPMHRGAIWSTDAIFRETRSKVAHFRDLGALAVEMELSALFTVGWYRKIEVGAILIVSDEVDGPDWNPGFKDERFRAGRNRATEVAVSLCRTH